MMKIWINLGLGVFMKRLAEITKGLKLGWDWNIANIGNFGKIGNIGI